MHQLLRANKMDELIGNIVEEELESAKERILTRIKRIKDGSQTCARRSMKLQFKNRISQVLLTGEEITGEGDTSLQVALVDDSTGNVVEDGPEASATVAIVLLKGEPDASGGDDWTVEQFNENIVQEMEGKKPLLTGNEPLKLQRGNGVLKNIKFKHHASKMRPSMFRLGARVVDTVDGDSIKVAKTEAFTVKDFRKKYYKKHKTPSLSDEVSRLVNIRLGGKIDKRLQHNKICTMEDFLIQLLIDPEGLRSIVNLGPKKWKATINNAQACPGEKRMYCYIKPEQKIGIVFNIFGQVLGLYLNNQYAQTNMLSESHKADAQELLASAYKQWRNVKPFDDEDSLRQYFTGLSTYMDPSFYPDEAHQDTEVIGESSSRSNFSLQSISSAMDSIGETVVEEFGTDDLEITEITFNNVFQPSPRSTFNQESPLNPEALVADFEDFLHHEQIAANVVAFVESQVVHSSKPPKRWKKLLCVSKWFSVRQKVSVRGNHNQKKQKVR